MRAVCDVCEAAPAQFFCAADEAALCTVCDEKVHGCNKLATRHVRLQLSEARAVPQCDICENGPAFFFCGIDGTSLCLQCDMDVHVGGKRTHERYLLLGQRVEPISKKPSIEQGVELQPFYTTKDGRRLENQLPHQSLQEKRDNSTSSANAIVVGDVDVERVSMMIDLNSQPHCMQGQTSNGIQCVRDMEIRSTSDDECTGAGESCMVAETIGVTSKESSTYEA